MFIIGIAGKAGAGKTTLAKMLVEELAKTTEIKTIILPISKSLKDFAIKLGWNAKKDKRGRKLLQLLGTEIGRNLIHKNLWVKYV